MIFRALSLLDLEQVRQWRNEIPSSLRTPFLLTEEMQQEYYVGVICNRAANSRSWGIWVPAATQIMDAGLGGNVDGASEEFVGLANIENIQWENRIGEIGLIISPESYGQGYGNEAVGMILDQGFNHLNLENIFGECYLCSPAIQFWNSICERLKAYSTMLPNRKFFEGRYHDALYFNFNKQEYKP